ncbi:MAG: DUF3786 domain-containing protein [Deltaproteobacteria bacterium]|nr:DUF3786 domain-containing protein [Deltaproteobacteria bacterium]
MARIDDYEQALKIARNVLRERDPVLLARYAGARILRDAPEGPTHLSLPFLNREVSISWPDLAFDPDRSGIELSVQQQILLLHYLDGAWSTSGAPVTGEWIAYQDVPDGKFYLDAFLRRAKNPLLQTFGSRPERMVEVATGAYDAGPLDHGDCSVVVKALPLVPVALILWKGDEEFPPEANLLFDRNISGILSAEDIAWLAGMVVYPLIGIAHSG